MEIGLLIRWGKIVPGREAQAIELFEESSKYYSEKVASKVITSFEPFFFATSDLEQETGFFVLKGPAPEMFRLMEEEEYHRLMQKGMLLLEHLQADLLTVGEGIVAELRRFATVRAELGM